MYFSAVIDLLKKDGNFREVTNFKQDSLVMEKFQSVKFDQLSYDSRKISATTLFFVKGQAFKLDYLNQAERKGLRFYVSQTICSVDSALVAILVKDVRKAMALIAQAFFGYPEEKLKIVAFTGTKGKTTSTYFTKGILDEIFAEKVAMFSTMETTLDGDHYFKSELTTPESLDLYEMMSQAIINGMTHLVMEVSSQAYKLQRVYGLTFDIGVFLNISSDHISPMEHPDFEDYFYCKLQLLHHSKKAILNRESDHFEELMKEVRNLGIPTYVYGRSEKECDYFINDNFNDLFDFKVCKGQRFHSESSFVGEYTLKIPGDFNQDNALAAMMAASLLGVDSDSIKEALSQISVPGRMERLTKNNGSSVYIDYAHNKLSLETLLQFVKKYHSGLLIVVLGSTGGKGISRRKDFGEVLSSFADVGILTADDPNFEDPILIAEEIAQSISSEKIKVEIIVDRKQAIRYALSLAKSAEDVVVLAGKGADEYQMIQGKKIFYAGDVAVAKETINTSGFNDEGTVS
ncbi:MAG: UDP-N-acetylmuramoyl-L-alanyl-D-glutamate--L-lysine ligase [Lactobacillales bacterium]|jgi:UDP-N-acetylmuramoyl-L-alanyl-D-glutamate-L-lysine ligase|nr:UDP-N-acetylmuramoyl-L-alanyl-D-glutamate--L-lysine ligase [Lactobacillales bacterium]